MSLRKDGTDRRKNGVIDEDSEINAEEEEVVDEVAVVDEAAVADGISKTISFNRTSILICSFN